jgi:hypothetical protein
MPVARAHRILLWSHALRTPWSPISFSRIAKTGATPYINHITVERFLKKALTMAYPDPNHHLRHLERCFMLHCLRVSACLDLSSAGFLAMASSTNYGGTVMISISLSESPISWSPPSALPSYMTRTPGAPTQSAARLLSKVTSGLRPGEAYSPTPVLPQGTHTIKIRVLKRLSAILSPISTTPRIL